MALVVYQCWLGNHHLSAMTNVDRPSPHMALLCLCLSPQLPEMDMLYVQVNFPNSFVGFGHPRRSGSFKSWILQFQDAHGTKETWAANRWIHFCLAYQRRTGHVRVVKVELMTSLVL